MTPASTQHCACKNVRTCYTLTGTVVASFRLGGRCQGQGGPGFACKVTPSIPGSLPGSRELPPRINHLAVVLLTINYPR